jgi:hypothetical protein
MSKNDQLLKQCANFEALSALSDRKIFLKTLAQSAVRQPTSFTRTSPVGGFDPELVQKYEDLDEFGNPKPHGIPAPPPAPAPIKALDMKPTTITGKYPPIAPEVQSVLTDLTGIPLKTDGKLGDQTRKALEAFKASHNIPEGLSDQEMEKAVLRAWYNKNKGVPSNAMAFGLGGI